MQIRILSNDEAFVESISSIARATPKVDVGEPNFVPGAVTSWWQLFVDIGAISLPMSVVGNLIASWIWDAMHSASPPKTPASPLLTTRKVKLVVLHQDTSVEVEILSDDREAIRASVETAVRDVDKLA